MPLFLFVRSSFSFLYWLTKNVYKWGQRQKLIYVYILNLRFNSFHWVARLLYFFFVFFFFWSQSLKIAYNYSIKTPIKIVYVSLLHQKNKTLCLLLLNNKWHSSHQNQKKIVSTTKVTIYLTIDWLTHMQSRFPQYFKFIKKNW